tara:strand:- start:265 stop:516 length:252 start_codon:yes stop_codon:yes gene_type:complete
MKYKNTTNNAIFVNLDEGLQLIQPGQEIVSKSPLTDSGLTALQVVKATPKATPKADPVPTPRKQTKTKPVNTNELPNTDPSKD